MERKEFIRNFAIGGSILFTAPLLLDSCSDGTDDIMNNNNNNNNSGGSVTVDLNETTYASLKSVGGYAYKGDIIIIRSTDTQYVALSKVCTHQGCTVMYDSTTNQVPCPCHGSLYSISGTVINGPAPASLKRYDVKLNGNILTIS